MKLARPDLVRLLVTGGAGFIGSNFVRHVLETRPHMTVTVLDKLTYAGNLASLEDISANPRFRFVKGDICDASAVEELARASDTIVNFAAESHVDRSIGSPGTFLDTDVLGVGVLLEAARRHDVRRFLQISTDEVYGDLELGSATEADPLRPRSPYSAAKAAADLLTLAYASTYALDVGITRSSNNYGPYQHPEKLVPLFITNALDHQPLPLYGDGQQVRDWLHVADNCRGILAVLELGEPGTIYNIGTEETATNMDLTKQILRSLDRPLSLIRHVEDRPGHDRRYAIATERIRALGWCPQHRLEAGLESTVAWYASHEEWWRPIKEGDFRDYYTRLNAARLAAGSPIE
ncbi:MAG: dTDP-glucose 4,6-dehydratase [Chloroflexota bacterium]